MQRKAAGAAPAGEAIRLAAIRLFAEKGFSATTTREICALARITKPVLYYHFQNKEHLYRELLLAAHAGAMREFTEAAGRAVTARDKLVAILSADFALTRREPKLARLLLRSLFAPPGEAPDLNLLEFALEWLRLLEAVVRAGIRAGELRGNSRAIAAAVMGIHLVYTIGFLLTGKPALSPSLATRIVRQVIEGCPAV